MTFEEALNKLALSDGASADEARRAYHKLLKVHKPEVDRDAFIALREAYECVRITIAMRAGQYTSPGVSVAPRPAEAEAPATSGAPRAADAESAGCPTPATEPPQSAPSDAPSAPAPVSLNEGDRFSKLLEARDYDAAAALLCESFDHFADRPTILPPVIVTLQLMLACHATNKLASANAIQRRFALWLERSGLETSLGPQAITMWVIARELSVLATSIPADVRCPIAEAVLASDLGKAKFRLATLSVEHPAAAASVLEVLRKKAPTLASTLGDAFGVSPPPPTKRVRSPSRSGGRWGWAILVLLSFRLLSASQDCSQSSIKSSSYLREAGEPPRSSPVEPHPADEAALQAIAKLGPPKGDLRQTIWSMLQLNDAAEQAATRCNLPELAEQTHSVRAQVERGNCSMALATMQIVIATTSTLPDEGRACVSAAVEAMGQSLSVVCPQEPPPPRKGKIIK
jgi:hypothetical protein